MATSPSSMQDDQQALAQGATPAPRVRVRMPATPSVRVRRATPFEQLFDTIRNTLLSEETLVLMEFTIIIAIGVVAFFTVFPTMQSAVDSIATYINKNFNTTF